MSFIRCILSCSPCVASLFLLLFSWGPDDNGKTVDGPHQLAQVGIKPFDFIALLLRLSDVLF